MQSPFFSSQGQMNAECRVQNAELRPTQAVKIYTLPAEENSD